MQPPQIKEILPECETKFLSLKTATYVRKDGQDAKWNFVERKGAAGVVTIIATNAAGNRYLFVTQPRVPVGKVVTAFPAGLMDPGDASPVDAARRELKEETGYDVQRVVAVSPVLPKSAGLTSESENLVQVVVDDAQVHPQQLEKTEDIEYFWATPQEALAQAAASPGTHAMESNAYSYLAGLVRGQPISPKVSGPAPGNLEGMSNAALKRYATAHGIDSSGSGVAVLARIKEAQA